MTSDPEEAAFAAGYARKVMSQSRWVRWVGLAGVALFLARATIHLVSGDFRAAAFRAIPGILIGGLLLWIWHYRRRLPEGERRNRDVAEGAG